MGYEGKSQLAEMRSSLGLESRVVSKLRGRETELGFGTQVETPGSLLLSRVGSQHRGLVRATAHSGTLPGFCPAQNSIRWGGGGEAVLVGGRPWIHPLPSKSVVFSDHSLLVSHYSSLFLLL